LSLTFQTLTPSKQLWLGDQLREAARFARQDGALPSLEELDAAFAKFIGHSEAANEQANSVVLCVGAAFGEHLVRLLGFEWVIATDDWGTDIAVVARRGRGDVTIFPADFVAKRWERREPHFLTAALGSIAETLKEAAADWGDNT
jgi:hypothetical protein